MNIYGAVIGDIVGSIYEVNEIKKIKSGVPKIERQKILNTNTPLFSSDSSFTDDSILTCAIANACLTDGNYEKQIRYYGNKEKDLGLDIYGRSKFGPGFLKWLDGGENNSWGNGCAMRISPVGYAFNSLEETLDESEKATTCSHNNIESINCAKAVAGSIFLARNNATKEEIKDFCLQFLDNLDFDLDDLQENYRFSSRAINSVPQAIFCFINSDSFEDCLRKSISIGGDSDTIASISCGIAGAFYEIPDNIISKAREYISDEYLEILDNFNSQYNRLEDDKDIDLEDNSIM